MGIILIGTPSIKASWAPTTPSLQGDVDVLGREKQAGDQYSNRLREAWSEYNTSGFSEAVELFESILTADDAHDTDVVQALYGAAISYSYLAPVPDLETARNYFELLLNKFSHYPAAAWALLELARMESLNEEEGRTRARAYLRRLMEDYPESLAIHEGALRMANTYFYELDPALTAKGIAILESHLSDYPKNPLASIMHFRLAYWYTETMHAHGKALPHSLRLGHLRMADPFRWSRHYWHIAQLYRLKFDEPEQARVWLRKIVEEAPLSEHTFAAKRILNKSERPDSGNKGN